MRKFYTKTKEILHRIGDIQLPHWTTVLIWFLGVLVMMGLTIKDLYPILTNYLDEDENALVSIRTENENLTIKPPQLFISMGKAYTSFFATVVDAVMGEKYEQLSAMRRFE